MDEVLRSQIRRFKADPNKNALAQLVSDSMRSGQGIFNIYDKPTLDKLFTDRNAVIPSVLGQIAALYCFLTGQNHPWKTCQVLVGATPSVVTDSDDQGGRIILDEFMVYLRAFEPLPFRPYSKLFAAYLAERVVWADRNGWEEDTHPAILTKTVKNIQANIYRNPPRLSQTLASLTAFQENFNNYDPDDEDANNATFEELYYLVQNGSMSELPQVFDTLIAVMQYIINIVDDPASVAQLHIAIEEARNSGLFQWCDSTVGDIEDWVEKTLMPRVIADAVSALKSAS